MGASAAALTVDVAAYALSLHLGATVALAATVGFAFGLVLIYAVSIRHVFRQRRLHNRRAEFGAFVAIGLAGLALTQALLWLLTERAQVAPIPAKMLTASCVFGFNFTLRKLLLFTRTTS